MGGAGWALLVIAALVVLGLIVSDFLADQDDPFASELERIEHEVHHARREIERLESEAQRAIDNAVTRRRLRRSL